MNPKTAIEIATKDHKEHMEWETKAAPQFVANALAMDRGLETCEPAVPGHGKPVWQPANLTAGLATCATPAETERFMGHEQSGGKGELSMNRLGKYRMSASGHWTALGITTPHP